MVKRIVRRLAKIIRKYIRLFQKEFYKRQLFKVNSNAKIKKLFGNFVSLVEVEVFSHCNRKCWFCPNSYIDRKSKNIYMDHDIYKKILNELSEVDYSKRLTFSRYNEPFSDEIIFERVKEARQKLPNAHIMTFTNGDFFNKETLIKAIDAGFNEVNIMVYFPENVEYNHDYIQKFIDKKSKELELDFVVTDKTDYGYFVRFNFDGLNLIMGSLDFRKKGTNRGDLLETINKYDRQEPCSVPIWGMYVDYNGNYVPCCNIRSDVKDHKKFVYGNAKDYSIFDIYNSKKNIAWKKFLSKTGKKNPPCDSCSYAVSVKEKFFKKQEKWK